MSKDIFGVSREVKTSDELASSEFATLSLGGGSPALIQDINYSYRRDVASIYEVGSSAVYFQAGRASGTLDLKRIIGKSGFHSLLSEGKCGVIQAVNISVKGSDCSASPARGQLTFDTGVVTSVSGNFSAGQLNISEDMSMVVSGLSS
jgi:hypothetical protein